MMFINLPPMNGVTIIWSMLASACLTLAGLHLLIWLKRRQAWGSFWFCLAATGTSLLALGELWIMRSQTIAQYILGIRWLHVPAFMVVVALVAFVRVYMRAGRPWLAWTTVGVRTLSLLLNFILTPNLNYRNVVGLHQVQFFGDSVSVGEGVLNPWMLVGQLSFLLWIIFVADAAVSVWRRGERQRAVLLGGSILFFATAGSVCAVLALWKTIDAPVVPSLMFLVVIISMAYELSAETTKAYEAHEARQESEHRLEMAAEVAHLGVWVRDLTTDEIRASEKWRSLFGFSNSEPLDFSLMLQRLHPNDRDDFRNVISRALRVMSSYETEYRLALPDGQMRWISSHGQVELNDQGKPARLLGLSMDITQCKVAELDAQRQRSQLAHFSRVTLLGELSGSMAHELNQPLTAILSNAQAGQRFLRQNDVDLKEVSEILADIVDQDQRASEVIRRLRLLLKEGKVQQLPLDLNDVLQEGLKLIRNDLVNHGVSLVREFAPSLPVVVGDRVQLQQVLLNLLMNACDAMVDNASGDRRVIVRTEAPNGQGVLCSVSDLGSGIPAEKLDQVFESFYSSKRQGLGLGLSVCRSIISAHGGRLWASNNQGRGATFQFTLPVGSEPRI